MVKFIPIKKNLKLQLNKQIITVFIFFFNKVLKNSLKIIIKL